MGVLLVLHTYILLISHFGRFRITHISTIQITLYNLLILHHIIYYNTCISHLPKTFFIDYLGRFTTGNTHIADISYINAFMGDLPKEGDHGDIRKHSTQ